MILNKALICAALFTSLVSLPVYAEGASTGDGSTMENKKDASSEMRQKQLESDIRAREQRYGTTRKISDGDLESLIRDKLELNLQERSLEVQAKQGNVVLKGKVASKAEADLAMRLAKGTRGVKQVRSQLMLGGM
jgi:hyperosmotically inducible periplasmic protein